jgi:hypothetical protein
MASDWYPTVRAQLIPFWNTFDTEANNYAGVIPDVLTAATLTEVGVGRDMVELVINFVDEAKNFASEAVAYQDLILEAPANTPLPAPPTVPAAPVIPAGAFAALESWIRALVARIKAHPNYTEAIGEAMGITMKAAGVGTPTVAPVALTQSQVQIAVGKAGYQMFALDRRINGGAWVEMDKFTNTPVIDQDPPLVPGQPEFREYRAQGVSNNQRVGPYSAVAGVWTVP